MRKWVLFIIKINPKLGALCKAEERYIENTALSFGEKMREAYKEILRHIDMKNRFINLRVIYRQFCRRLTEEELYLLRAYVRGESAANLAERLSVSRSTAFRIFDKCIGKCERELELSGFDLERLEREYSDIYSIINN